MLFIFLLCLSFYFTKPPCDTLSETVRYLLTSPSVIYSSMEQDILSHPSTKAYTQHEDRIVEVSRYYQSVAYKQDMIRWESISKLSEGMVLFPRDCYTLSSPTINELTPDDRMKIASNLFHKLLPNLAYFASRHKHAELAATQLLFFHILINSQGSDGSKYIIPTYHNQSLISLQYAASFHPGTRKPVSFFTPNIAYSYVHGKSPIYELDLPSNEQDFESFLVRENVPEKYQSALRELYSYLQVYPIPQSDTIELPATHLASILSGIFIPYFFVFSKQYPVVHCL